MASVAVERAIAKIARRNGGRITPEALVSEAEKQGSGPLYEAFEWNNAAGAHQYRLAQARKLIKSFTFVAHPDTIHEARIPVWIVEPSVDARGKGGYSRTQDVAKDAGRSLSVVMAAFERSAQALRSARELAVGLGLDGDEIDRVIREIVGLAPLANR